jgi:alkanesulfonate monooxygenase SsuD/methylene tetrahydromethanopterin reductase-like flavin-dependent oxidoreductase (luciferase family)
MRFSYAEAMVDPSFYLPLARAAEAAGYDAFVVPDNLGFPGKSDARYLIPAMAAVTERLRFHTLVVKLPVRLPYLVAKQATSIAVLSGNRFGFGVGLSPWPEDFRICGQDWESRGKRMDEMIEIIRGFAAGGFYEFHGEHYDIQPMKMCPVPSEPIPILIGGHSGPALRRAARLGDGWMHAGGDPAELAGMLERIATLRKEYGREHLPFEVHVISFDAWEPDGLKRLEDLGVTDAIVGFRNPYHEGPDTETLDEKLAALEDFANRVIARR